MTAECHITGVARITGERLAGPSASLRLADGSETSALLRQLQARQVIAAQGTQRPQPGTLSGLLLVSDHGHPRHL